MDNRRANMIDFQLLAVVTDGEVPKLRPTPPNAKIHILPSGDLRHAAYALAQLAVEQLALNATLLERVMHMADNGTSSCRTFAASIRRLATQRNAPPATASIRRLSVNEIRSTKANALVAARQTSQAVIDIRSMIGEPDPHSPRYFWRSCDSRATMVQAHSRLSELHAQASQLFSPEQSCNQDIVAIQQRILAMLDVARQNNLVAQRAVDAIGKLQWQVLHFARTMESDEFSSGR